MVEITLMQKIELAYSFTNKQKISTLRDLTFVSFNFIFKFQNTIYTWGLSGLFKLHI